MRQRVVIAWDEKKVKKKSVLAIPNRSSYQFFCSPCWWVGVIIRGRKKMKLKFLQCSEFTLYVFLCEKKTDAENEFAIWSFPFSYKFNKDQFSAWKKKNVLNVQDVSFMTISMKIVFVFVLDSFCYFNTCLCVSRNTKKERNIWLQNMAGLSIRFRDKTRHSIFA